MDPEAVITDKEQCLPIDNVDGVIAWKKPEHSWARLVNPLKKRTKHCYPSYPECNLNSQPEFKDASYVPKTLVCHDMQGGYGADRWVHGTDCTDQYKFLAWSCIDTFVYFSHKLVTIPPLCWINAGHTHGVKVLGTLITEGKDGAKIWEDLSVNEEKRKEFAIQLAEICHFYGFDGYLINIENKMSYNCMEQFIHFLGFLIKTVKSIAPEKIFIWYDAVTHPFGTLKWQNQLNLLNRKFFELCDGIFLNYGWSEDDLKQSVKEAGDRKTDVYVGIDVFGRGCYGGGGFITCEAMNIIRNYGLSAAIFAPGWVFELCEIDENADNRDFMFWELIKDYVYSYGPAQLPFETSFCRGFGLRKYKEGQVVRDHPWCNLSEMNHLPGILSGLFKTEESSCLIYYQDDGYNGGGCLLVKPLVTKSKPNHCERLFVCDFFCYKGNITIKVISKPITLDSDAGINFILNLIDHKDSESHSEETIKKMRILPIKYDYKSCKTVSTWTTSDFIIDIGCSHITSIDCMLSYDCTPVLIGCFSIEGKKYDIAGPEDGCPKLSLTRHLL